MSVSIQNRVSLPVPAWGRAAPSPATAAGANAGSTTSAAGKNDAINLAGSRRDSSASAANPASQTASRPNQANRIAGKATPLSGRTTRETGLNDVWNSVTNFCSNFANNTTDIVRGTWDGLKNFSSGLTDAIFGKQSWGQFFSNFGKETADFWKDFGAKSVQSAWDIGNIFVTTGKMIYDSFKGLFGKRA